MYKISTADCLGCGACEGSCPAGAIVPDGDKFKITDSCLDCGTCAGGCPASAISEG
jgi:MinD superfamily P-loop ATPase